jgi:hypothetical protein
MQPVRFRITDEHEEEQVVKIENYQERKSDNFTKDKRIYDCLVIVNGVKKRAEIHYNISSMKWVLYNLK